MKADLQAGFFEAHLYLFIDPSRLSAFLADLDRLDKTLAGFAKPTAEGPENVVEMSLVALRHGHMACHGAATVGPNSLRFRFETDQTQLRPMYRWFSAVLDKYHRAS